MSLSTAPIALRVKQVAKKYARNGTITELRSALANLFQPRQIEYFWALHEVSFEVRQGEILGIIGENGSGKSTLLKILSGITKPTTGQVEIYGQVASILDIGTGFHPDLTGRENLYLRAGFLGVSRERVEQQMPHIQDFSGIAHFLDMPIKHYSDGMFLRLAFSFLLLIDSDILLLDEVLRVGDAGFQLKCIEKIQQIARNGKTIIMVSHNPQELIDLCTSFLHLENGKVKQFGNSPTILQSYLHSSLQKIKQPELFNAEQHPNCIRWQDMAVAPGNDLFKIIQISVTGITSAEQLFSDEDLWLEVMIQKLSNEGTIDIAFSLNNEISPFMVCHPFHTQNVFRNKEQGIYRSRCKIPAHLLNKGYYQIGVFAALDQKQLIFSMSNILQIQIKSRISLGATLDRFLDIPMPLMPVFEWELHEPTNVFVNT